MSTREKAVDLPALEALISECFEGGQILSRQLRLSETQADCLRTCYPTDLRPMGGAWYEITFQGAFNDGN